MQPKFKNVHGTIILYEVGDDGTERLISGFANLAFVFDKDGGVLHKYGENDKIEAYYKEVKQLYKVNGMKDMADNLVLVSSDKWPVDLIDKFLNCSGYIGKWYEEEMKKAAAGSSHSPG